MEENTNFIIYHNPNGEVKVDVFIEGETVWLTQKSMGELFGVVKSTISDTDHHTPLVVVWQENTILGFASCRLD